MNISELSGRKVVLWGLGREGWSILRAIEERRAKPFVTVYSDAPLSPEDERGLAELSARSGIPCETASGPALRAVLDRAEVLVKSPGVSLYRAEIRDAVDGGLAVTSATSLWAAENLPGNIIVVTGTKGKSTTSLLLSKLLEHATAETGARVRLGGNIGTPLFDLPHDSRPGDYWVIELSSYQLADAVLTPHAVLILNLYPEHVDWHGTVERYYRDKLRALELAGPDTLVVRNALDARLCHAGLSHGRELLFNHPSGATVRDGAFFFGERRLFDTSALNLPGPQNLANACAALTVLAGLGFDPISAEEVFRRFVGLPHRLKVVAERSGVTFVDDSISTVPQSALAAFEAFRGRPVTALLGGFERAQDWDALAEGVCAAKLHAVVTLPDSGSKIASAIRRVEGAGTKPEIFEAANLEEAVQIAAQSTPKGGVVLLSPAAPSYGRFKNFEERGRKFAELALALKDAGPSPSL